MELPFESHENKPVLPSFWLLLHWKYPLLNSTLQYFMTIILGSEHKYGG